MNRNTIFKKDNKLADFSTLQLIENTKKKLQKQRKELAKLQDVMYAHNKYGVLICLQGMDTSGKDSLIREVFKEVNANGVQVHSFKVPTSRELSHDFLWRHYIVLPERGNISIFNRTHYENVLVTRVHPAYILGEDLPSIKSVEDVTDDFFHQRMQQINSFEKHLVANGTIILKFYLNLSKEEQKNRLLRRLDLPEKNWKFSAGDLKERKLWEKYMKVYEDMFKKTSTDYAPWHIIPADDKKTARLFVAKIIVNELSKYQFKYPTLSKKEKNNLDNYRKEINIS
jgi:PPK2 family polyphosphate:nucleotide phosphotransferase